MTAKRNGRSAIEISGNGPPVVLVHGLGLNRHMWRWQVPALEQRFTAIRYDLLGHGESDAPPVPCGLGDFSDQLLEVIDALQHETCAVVGFSLGGMIARAFAMRHPERVSALAILNSAHDRTEDERAAILKRVERVAENGPAATVEAALDRWFTPAFAKHNPSVIEQVRRWAMANDAKIYAAIYRVLAEGDRDIAEGLEAIRCPTLVLTGEQDYGNSAEMAKRMAALIPDSRISILPGLRHMALAEDPEAVNRVVIPFLEESLPDGK